MRWSPSWLALGLVLGIGAGCAAPPATQSGTSAGEESRKPGAPAAAQSLTPTPAREPTPLERVVDSVAPGVAAARGMKAELGGTLPVAWVSARQARRRYRRWLLAAMPIERWEAVARAYVVLGYSRTKTDLLGDALSAMGVSVYGFFEPKAGWLWVLDRGEGLRAATAKAQPGEALADTLRHELVHLGQHRRHDLFVFQSLTGDAGAARAALVEGDATLTAGLVGLGRANPGAGLEALSGWQRAYAGQWDLASRGAIRSRRTGNTTRRALGFPYRDGSAFVLALYAKGGFAAVDRAFGDPPTSTEQVLHPGRYLSSPRDEPIVVPSLSASTAGAAAILGEGWSTIFDETLGEQGLRLLFAEWLPWNEVVRASAGWGGDRVTVFEHTDGRAAVVLRYVGDTATDAAEFLAAYEKLAAERGDARERFVWADGRTVTVIEGLSRERAERVNATPWGDRD